MNDPSVEVVKVLISAGADVNQKGKDGFNIIERYFSYTKNIDPDLV